MRVAPLHCFVTFMLMRFTFVKHLFALLATSVTVAVCAQEKPKDTATIYLDTLNISAKAGPIPYQASATQVWDIIHTRIALSFNGVERTAAAREWIQLHPYFYATDTLELDAKGMKIDSVLLVGKKGNSPLKYTYDSEKLKIWMGKTYQATDTIQLYLKYTAMPYAAPAGGSAAITDDKGLYFINTDGRTPNKQAHIWTQGETESNSRWMITIDKPNSRFTTQVELTIADSLTTLSNGTLVKQSKMPGGLRTDIWKMDIPIQAYAVMFAISKYAVVKDSWRGKEVSYYVEPSYAPYARKMFGHTTEMMDVFSAMTGVPYPWNKYSQVVVRDYVSGAMENTTASLFGEFMNQTDREMADKSQEDIVAHELFHQWFGDYVTCESWSNTTINESFANYGEQLWRAAKHGKAFADELGWNDLQLYILSARAHDPQLVRFYYDDKEQMFDAISYNKGGAILHYLNTLIGDAAFDRAMNIVLTRNALQPIEAHHWRLAVEEATGQDWNWFFNEWYYHAGHPALKVHYNYSDSAQNLVVEVSQTQPDSAFMYALPLKTEVIYGDKTTRIDWNINKRKHTFTYPYVQGQKPVVIPDAAHVLPGEIKENKKPEQWLKQYVTTTDYIGKRLAVVAAGKSVSDSSSQELLDRALNDTFYLLRRYALMQLETVSNEKFRRRWVTKVTEMAATDKNNEVRKAAFDVITMWKTGTAMPLILSAVWDSSYMVAAAALEALDKQDKDTAYALAKKLVSTKPGGALESIVYRIIAKRGDVNDIGIFEQKAPFVHGGKRTLFSMTLTNYMNAIEDSLTFARAANVYADMAIYETMRAQRSAIGGNFFQSIDGHKDLLKDEDKQVAAMAEMRMNILKTTADRIIAAEQDEELKKKFEKMKHDNFE